MTIRPATRADLAGILALERSLATAPHWSVEVYESLLGGDASRCTFVAETEAPGPKLVGFAVGLFLAGEGELESVAVDREQQRRGVGRALCQAVIQGLAAAGAQAITLEVRGSSDGAQRLYRRLGFVEIGRRPLYYDHPAEDALVMRLELQT